MRATSRELLYRGSLAQAIISLKRVSTAEYLEERQLSVSSVGKYRCLLSQGAEPIA